jgi:hypothetical protein
MKNIRFLFLALITCSLLGAGNAYGQKYDLPGTGIKVDAGSSDFAYTTGTNVLATTTVTVSTSGGDTATLKLIGGNEANSLHFWSSFTKASGATDSITITIWGIVKDSKTPSANTLYKSLNSGQTANSSGEQVFDLILTGNDYTEYMVVTRKIGVTAGAGTVKHLLLVR